MAIPETVDETVMCIYFPSLSLSLSLSLSILSYLRNGNFLFFLLGLYLGPTSSSLLSLILGMRTFFFFFLASI